MKKIGKRWSDFLVAGAKIEQFFGSVSTTCLDQAKWPETRDLLGRDRDETETLSTLSKTRPRRDVSTSRDRLETETSRLRPHPCQSASLYCDFAKFWTPHFFLDSTLFCLDSTIWLDSTLKLYYATERS